MSELDNECNLTLSAEAYAKLIEYADMRELSIDAAIIDMADKAGRLVRSKAKLKQQNVIDHHLDASAKGKIDNPYINYKVFTGYPKGTPFFTIMWDFVDIKTKYADLSKRYGGALDVDTGRRHIICTYKHQDSYDNKYQTVQLIFTGENGQPVFGIEFWENGIKLNTEIFESITSAIIIYKRLIDTITGTNKENAESTI